LLGLDISQSEREVYLDKALQKAATHSNFTLCTWLLEQGANVNFAGGEFGSPLQAAVSYQTLSHPATQNNRSLIISMLLKYGVNMNVIDPERAWPSPLMAAMNSYSQTRKKTSAVFVGSGKSEEAISASEPFLY
jgi:hypothetical protein